MGFRALDGPAERVPLFDMRWYTKDGAAEGDSFSVRPLLPTSATGGGGVTEDRKRAQHRRIPIIQS